MLKTSAKSGAVIAEELGISDGSLYTWRKQLTQQGKQVFPGKGHQNPTEEEFRQLRSENGVPLYPKQRLEFPVRVLCKD